MSYYGGGEVSADFIGIARRARQAALPEIVQIYVSGCSGNVTAGKYNDGSRDNRSVLAGRIEAAMARPGPPPNAGHSRRPTSAPCRSGSSPAAGAGYSHAELTERMTTDPNPYGQCLAAMGLSWRHRLSTGQPVDLPVLDLGHSVVALLPGEAYVEYQLRAQALRPDAFVLAVGYGESATGYIPTARQLTEGDPNLGDWYWVSETAERILNDGLERALLGNAR